MIHILLAIMVFFLLKEMSNIKIICMNLPLYEEKVVDWKEMS